MVNETIDELKQLRQEFEKLDKTFTTTQIVKIDTSDIKQKLSDDMKREMAGRTSYGVGV